jgi:hypothetical protein
VNKQLIEFKLNDGSTVVFETDLVEPEIHAGDQRVANTARHGGVQKSTEMFESVVGRIRPAAQLVLDALLGLSTPRKIELEFGVKFNAKTGVVIASVDSDVSFKVRVNWENSAH